MSASSVQEFVQRLSDSGLWSRAELTELSDLIEGNESLHTTESLVTDLLDRKKITPFQAEVLLGDDKLQLSLGSYILVERIGAGGMGEVFKAYHRRMDRTVALKVLSPQAVDSPEAVRRFNREMRAAARLAHPNIITAFDADEMDGVLYLVMEYVDGDSLSALIKSKGALPIDHVINYSLQTAEGLAYAHEQGVIHRDIKPSNILVDRFRTVKILDMGLARIDLGMGTLSDGSMTGDLTKTGAVMGTVDYMSPEQAFDVKKVDHRADIYSLGCTLFYMLTGRTLFEGNGPLEIMLAHHERETPRIEDVIHDAPADLCECFTNMIAKKPEDRFQTMAEVVVTLRKLAADCSAVHDAPTIAPTTLTNLGLDSTLKTADSDSFAGSSLARPKPQSPKNPKMLLFVTSDLVEGEVVEAYERVRIEDGWRTERYVIELAVSAVEAGDQFSVGDHALVHFARKQWCGEGQSAVYDPGFTGEIPNPGDTVRVYMKKQASGINEVVLPNGLAVEAQSAH